ncbi:hypothetical protein [Lactiplantibacillus plantarum]|uniref:hypothetical protein n=1 Tax=Lactiplantibacillus plantarum TaxID=1590 RepID=UPI000D58C7F6|nr:hypothetical protein [Lactiplantibacillus plantarum]AWI40534.1 hypothetical protein LpLQ80_08370 [Lactiplantibacillus plantarum]WLT35119.1 hypothetical protein FQU65_08060 [Lactiplantibacillus plantarum]
MKILLTNATNYLGTLVTDQLIRLGHQIYSPAPTQPSADHLRHLGVTPLFNSTVEQALQATATTFDAIIIDTATINEHLLNLLTTAFKDTNKPLLLLSSVANQPVNITHANTAQPTSMIFQIAENIQQQLLDHHINTALIRLAPSTANLETHQGVLNQLVTLATKNGYSAYIGPGLNHWNVVDPQDAADLITLVLTKLITDHPTMRQFNAIANFSLTTKSIAITIGNFLHLPTVSIAPTIASQYFGELTHLMTLNLTASSTQTQQYLNWHPKTPDVSKSLAVSSYFWAFA